MTESWRQSPGLKMPQVQVWATSREKKIWSMEGCWLSGIICLGLNVGLKRSILWSAWTSSVGFVQCWKCIFRRTNEVLYDSGGMNTCWSNLWGQVKLVRIFFVWSVQPWWHEWSSSLHHVIKDSNVILKHWPSHDSTSPQLDVQNVC